MSPIRIRHLATWLPAVLLASGLLVAGCQTCSAPSASHEMHGNRLDKCATIPPGALPEPLGTFVHEFQDVQASKAAVDFFVVYANEWFMGGQDLGPYGSYHVARLAKRLPECANPVVIQISMEPRLDLIRKQKVIEELANAGVTDAVGRVILGYPEALDFDGNQAPRTYYQMLSNQGGGGLGLFGAGGLGGLGGFGGIGGSGGIGGFGGYGGFGGAPFGH